MLVVRWRIKGATAKQRAFDLRRKARFRRGYLQAKDDDSTMNGFVFCFVDGSRMMGRTRWRQPNPFWSPSPSLVQGVEGKGRPPD